MTLFVHQNLVLFACLIEITIYLLTLLHIGNIIGRVMDNTPFGSSPPIIREAMTKFD